MHGGGWGWAAGTVDGVENVLNGTGVEVGGGGDAALVDELEAGRERGDGLGGAVAADAAQLEEIVGGGDGDQQAAIVAQDAAEFGGVHARGDGKKQGERVVRIGDEAIGVGDDP